MSDARRYITGVLLTEQGGAPIADATVLVTRGTGTRKKVIGRARSDSKGRYSVRVEDDGLTASSGALSLRVEHQGKELDLGYDSQASIELSSLPLERDLWATVPIQRPRRPKGNALPTWHITGSLRHVDGSVPDDGDVSLLAMEVGIAGSDPLELETGESATYTNGTYVIPLAESVEGKNVRVLVKNSGGTVVLGASQVTLSADENPRIDILLSSEESRGKAEYARLKIGVEATLSGGLAAGQLSADHLLYIGATRSLEAEALGRYEVAARVAGKLTIPTGQESTDWTEHIFGLISVGWPSSVPELLSRPWSRVSAALELAYQRGHIRAAAAAQSSALEQVWNTSRVALALVDDASATKGSLKPILVAAGVPEEDPDYLQTALVTEWVNHTGTVATFWENLREHSTLGAYADEVQRAFQVGALVGNHAPMVGKVLEELDGAALRTLCDMEEADWLAWIGSTWNGETVEWPSRYDEEDEPEDAYAADIVDAVATAFPARRTAQGVADGTGIAGALYADFSGNTNNADLIAHFAGDLDFDPGGPPVSGTDDDTRIRRFQRLYRLAPSSGRAEGAIRLFEKTGVRSARDIASMGKRRFLSTATGVSVGFESADALEIFQKARNLSSMATILATMLHPSLRRGYAQGLVEVVDEPSGEGAPDVATLFGSQDTCACDPCLSVTSPAAYLVDLLQWVEERGGWSDDATPPQWALNGRRPDLGQIALSCENTFRVLPYVDLVNEVLEDAVAGLDAPPPPTVGDTGYAGSEDFDPVAPSERDTTLTPEELLVTPEYRNDTAYERLEDADTAYYSHRLPYHHDNAEQRAFLGILGLRRQDLLELGDADATVLALEELGLCQGDVDLITGSQHGARRWGFFGDTTNGTSVASFIDALSSLRTFRDRSGLDLEAILELLHCRAVNPEIGSERPRDVLVVTLDDDCSLDASLVQHAAQAEDEEEDVLTALSVTEIGTLSRFLRVARALGGTLLHADRALHMLDEGDASAFDTETLLKAGLVQRLSRQLGLDRETVSSFFSYFDAAEHLDTWQDRDAATKPQPCLYDRVFMDARRFPDATSEATWEDWPFVLDAARTALEIETHLSEGARPLTSYAAEIAAALRVPLPELAEAIDWSGEEALSFTALGALHRRVKLAAALGRPVREVRQLAELIRPTSGALSGDLSADWIFEGPEEMAAFVDELGRLSAMKVDTARALYLVAHDEDAVTALRPTAAETQNALGALRDELWSLSSDYPLSEELGASADEDTLEALIREILDLDDETVTPTVVDDLIATAQGDWYSAGPSARTPRWEDLLSDLSADATARPLLNVLDLYDLRAQLIGRTAPAVERLLTSEADRLSWLDANLRWGAWRLGQREALRAAAAKSLTDLLGRTGRFANRLRELTLSEVWPPASSDESFDSECVDALLTRGFLAFPSEQPDLPYADLVQPEHDLPDALQDAFVVYYALHKVATYLSSLGANEDEEEAVLAQADALELPDPGAFPASAPEDPRAGWQELRRALVLFAQADRVPGSTPTFAELIAVADSTSALVELLAQRTGWDSEELTTLTGSAWYTGGGGDPVEDLRRLLDALALRDKAGIDASGVIDWLTEGEGTNARDATPALSAAARDAASAKAGDPSAWVARARPVRDTLRERQRQALLCWVLDRGDSPWDDADDVYEHYLIDVSMGSWLTTSRIQLALAAVQLYVQRNMMGLETDDESEVAFDDEDREQWAWMKNYRVWEAARKVFLYPENWTDPELRDDESVFYEELRSELSQGALDDDHVEGAALAYLEKLRDVHSMHVLTYTRQQETVDGEALDHTHVLARTRGNPPGYYYRRWEDQRL